jgi:hypothetical protein
VTVNPALKYTLGRLAILVVCVVPIVLLLPSSMNLFLKLMIAFVVSAVVSYFALRRWREEVTEQLASRGRSRAEERRRLRSALSGEDEGSTTD